MFRTKHFSSRKKKSIEDMVHICFVFLNCLHYSSYYRNPWSVNIMSLWEFISILVGPALPPSFSHIFMFRTKHFSCRKKSIWDKVHIWLLITAYIYIYNLGTLCVCLFVRDNLSHHQSYLHEIWAQFVFWANLKHCEVGFLNFNFLRGAAIYP